MNNREKFLSLYANLPLPLRDEIVLVVDNKPISWNVAYLEVDANTPLSQEILSTLENLQII